MKTTTRARMRTSRLAVTALALLTILGLTSCGLVKINVPGLTQEDTPTPAPTATTPPTATPRPTATAEPTATAAPAATPAPTRRAAVKPRATATPEASEVGDTLRIDAVEDVLDVDTARVTLVLQADGEDGDGEPLQGEMRIDLLIDRTTNSHAVTLSGDAMRMIGDPDLGQADRIELYYLDGNTYQYITRDGEGTCERDPANVSGFEDVSPETILESFVSAEEMSGEPDGEEEVNGVTATRYTLDVDRMRETAEDSDNDNWASTTAALVSGDLYLASDDNYVVRYVADYDGDVSSFNLDGQLSVEYDLVEVNGDAAIEPPGECGLMPDDHRLLTPEPTGEGREGVEQIVFRPITESVEVESMLSTMTMELDGKNEKGKRIDGDITIEMIENVPDEQRSLVMGGSALPMLMGDSAPSGVSVAGFGVYKLGGHTYVYMKGEDSDDDLCVASGDEGDNDMFEDLTPESMIVVFAGNEDVYGRYAGDETINGIETRHYEIDAGTTNEAMAKSRNPEVRRNARTQKVVSGDVYVAAGGGYLVRFSALYEGDIASMDYNGNTTVTFDLAELNTGVGVELPAACDNPITP